MPDGGNSSTAPLSINDQEADTNEPSHHPLTAPAARPPRREAPRCRAPPPASSHTPSAAAPAGQVLRGTNLVVSLRLGRNQSSASLLLKGHGLCILEARPYKSTCLCLLHLLTDLPHLISQKAASTCLLPTSPMRPPWFRGWPPQSAPAAGGTGPAAAPRPPRTAGGRTRPAGSRCT